MAPGTFRVPVPLSSVFPARLPFLVLGMGCPSSLGKKKKKNLNHLAGTCNHGMQ